MATLLVLVLVPVPVPVLVLVLVLVLGLAQPVAPARCRQVQSSHHPTSRRPQLTAPTPTPQHRQHLTMQQSPVLPRQLPS